MSDFEDIYETMMGFRTLDAPVPWVENAFEDDQPCMNRYEQMRDAYERVCERLGVGEEDMDLDIMVSCMESIQKELCQRMFDCGIRFVTEKHYFDSRK